MFRKGQRRRALAHGPLKLAIVLLPLLKLDSGGRIVALPLPLEQPVSHVPEVAGPVLQQLEGQVLSLFEHGEGPGQALDGLDPGQAAVFDRLLDHLRQVDHLPVVVLPGQPLELVHELDVVPDELWR
jgi:hypothetical protein